MRLSLVTAIAAKLALLPALPTSLAAQNADARLEALKVEALELVEGRAKLVQVMVDKLFSFGELGMQEFETQRYLTGILEVYFSDRHVMNLSHSHLIPHWIECSRS